ncbi:carbohydrate ABC transporter substrate-binding protein [Photobacterium frigidiphilum]|uniref:Probable sugar-binding periplasmic protein n=1 Tax=Photobacterium frigidiphilum TaxID=264736 RepID=A0A2T3JFN7_9GAMM|nr:ABC transporter substrate-binding protein [Photobacterium frigidiphilum]PSU47736.1 carbohydrate ABC transporter substrate-binding protein [Photobacterium frigidiphilum]
MHWIIKTALLTTLLHFTPVRAEIELLHWWTSKGEIKALNTIKKQLNDHDYQMVSTSVIGGGGDTATTVLQARALAGNTPNIAQIEGPSIKAWDAIGILHNLNNTAKKHQWNETLNPLAKEINQTENGYVALPLTLHRMNWLWVNHDLLTQLALDVPVTWPELFIAMDKAKRHHIEPLAIGKQPWQIAQLFESLVIAYGGVDFYQQAMVNLDKTAISSQEMQEIFKQFRRLSLLVGEQLADHKWETATQYLAQDKALFQIGGDWILGELIALNIDVPKKIGCYVAPQTQGVFLYNMDSFIFMSRPDFTVQQANDLANVLADKTFQSQFNKVKGAIPVRNDIDLSGFNVCQQQASQDLEFALIHKLAVPSMTDSMAVNPIKQQAINNELFQFFKNDSIDSKAVIRRIIAIASSDN